MPLMMVINSPPLPSEHSRWK